MASERIYKVTVTVGEKKRIAMVKAPSMAQATRHALKDMVEAKVASSIEVASHMEKGGTIQNTDGNVAAQSEPATE